MPSAKARASTILGEFEQAPERTRRQARDPHRRQGRTVESISLDQLHGLRLSIRGNDGKWPIAIIKFAQTD
jgi:hypothetical protein